MPLFVNPSIGIGSALTSATAGSVLFAGAAGVLGQDNANLFWDDTNNRLGIGTATPNNSLQVAGCLNFDDSLANLWIGTLAGSSMIDGAANVGIGYQAMAASQHPTFCTAVGANALLHNTADNATAIGMDACYAQTSGPQNVGIGYQALFANTTGGYNIAIGTGALSADNGDDGNTAIGYGALLSLVSGGHNTLISRAAGYNLGTGSFNFGLGAYALFSLTAGSNNFALGYQAGGVNLATGSGNILIGNNIDTPASNTSNYFSLDNALYGDLSAKSFRIGAPTPTARLHLPAVSTAASSAPIKLEAGTLMTSAENGAIEYDGTHLYITIGGVRKQLDN